jgi:type 1 glutamine amidotransferase
MLLSRRIVLLVALLAVTPSLRAADPWLTIEGKDGPGKGKHVVLVSGDEEYRSEEALPQLAKILANNGFHCTVLFAIDPKDGTINPGVIDNIPGLEALKTADLMVIFLRWRTLPDDQMKHIVEYVESGKPVVGLRTATHCFKPGRTGPYAKYSSDSKVKGYEGGFGRQVLGETWVNHHGQHGKEGTRGLLAKGQEKHPILKGIKDGDIFGPSGVYEVRQPMRDTCTPLVLGQALSGMKPTDPPAEGNKFNNPIQPVAWTNKYTAPGGKTGRAFATTMGASEDFESEGFRRLVVNAVLWAGGLEDKIPERTNVELVGEYKPTPYKFNGAKKGVKPEDLLK